jgi:hypothetical protein
MRSAVLITPGGVCTISAVVTARHPLSMLRTASMDVGPRRQGIQPGLAPSEVCPDCVSIRSRGMRTQGKSPPCWHHDSHASSQHSPSFRPRGILCPSASAPTRALCARSKLRCYRVSSCCDASSNCSRFSASCDQRRARTLNSCWLV